MSTPKSDIRNTLTIVIHKRDERYTPIKPAHVPLKQDAPHKAISVQANRGSGEFA